MNSLCQTCRKLLYRTDPCRGVGVECGRTDGGSKKSTAARKDVPAKATGRRSGPKGQAGSREDVVAQPDRAEACEPAVGGSNPSQQAGTQAPPVDTKPKHKDRHKPGYQAEKQRQYRANKKAKEAAK